MHPRIAGSSSSEHLPFRSENAPSPLAVNQNHLFGLSGRLLTLRRAGRHEHELATCGQTLKEDSATGWLLPKNDKADDGIRTRDLRFTKPLQV
jgi:hypothetical protein